MEEFNLEYWHQLRYQLKSRIMENNYELAEVGKLLEISEEVLSAYLFKQKLPLGFHYRKIKAYLFVSHYKETQEYGRRGSKEKNN